MFLEIFEVFFFRLELIVDFDVHKYEGEINSMKGAHEVVDTYALFIDVGYG